MLGQMGPARVSQILFVSYALPLVMEALVLYSRPYPKLKKLWQWASAGRDIRRYRRLRGDVLKAGQSGYRLALSDFGLPHENLDAVRAQLRSQKEIVLADIDQDGFLRSHFGPLDDVRTAPASEFVARKRFALTVVAEGETVGVRKDYRGDRLSFVTELKALHRLGLAGCKVPALMNVDFDRLTLTFSYVKGRELRLELAARGAALLDRVIEQEPGYHALSREQKRLKQIDQGRPHVRAVVDEAYVERLFDELRKIHRAGFVWKDLKYGNMLIAAGTQQPYLIDFDSTYDHSRTGRLLFRLLCDRNIEDFNRCFGTAKPTYERVKDRLRKESAEDRSGYSPAYFGYGLRTGTLLKNYVGYGRWHFMMKEHVPPLAGARLLDLGANDAFQALQCLRHGAAQAIAIERSPAAIERGQWFREVFEWADNRRYDFRYVQGDMSHVPAMQLGRFDFAMALCSIYYLDDRGIADVITHLSTMTDTLLLMCNSEPDIGRTDPREYIKASVAYTVDAMARNGFSFTTVVAPSSYSRPLVIGRTRSVPEQSALSG